VRLWSLHPKHLDAKGLVALWREGLLARTVLAGRTKGYRHHPQLERFRSRPDPMAAIDGFLSRVYDEAVTRGYAFDADKIEYRRCAGCASVKAGQLAHEWEHLRRKLYARDRARWARGRDEDAQPHPCFRIVRGGIEDWERIASKFSTATRTRSVPTSPS